MLRILIPLALCLVLSSCGKSESGGGSGAAPTGGNAAPPSGGGGGTAGDSQAGGSTPEDAYKRMAEAGARSDWKTVYSIVAPDDRDLFIFSLTFGAAFASMGAKDPAAVEQEAKDLFAKHRIPEKKDGDGVDMNDEAKMRAKVKEMLKDVPDKGALAGDLIMFMKKHATSGSDFSMFDGTLKDVKIEGEKATATLVKSPEKTSEIKFARHDGRWYLAIGK